ncbi:hypothetical protein Scep_028106 [Stephania cephalantha]|uniref:Uncharacterized protein n=1 Tax=Stephania cephalantha TaxID=152367 RepID=A0AAP0HJ78_9MAGN
MENLCNTFSFVATFQRMLGICTRYSVEEKLCHLASWKAFFLQTEKHKELLTLDACCVEDENWDAFIPDKPGDYCRRRVKQMINHLGAYGFKSFQEQVEVLSNLYCPYLVEALSTTNGKASAESDGYGFAGETAIIVVSTRGLELSLAISNGVREAEGVVMTERADRFGLEAKGESAIRQMGDWDIGERGKSEQKPFYIEDRSVTHGYVSTFNNRKSTNLLGMTLPREVFRYVICWFTDTTR